MRQLNKTRMRDLCNSASSKLREFFEPIAHRHTPELGKHSSVAETSQQCQIASGESLITQLEKALIKIKNTNATRWYERNNDKIDVSSA